MGNFSYRFWPPRSSLLVSVWPMLMGFSPSLLPALHYPQSVWWTNFLTLPTQKCTTFFFFFSKMLLFPSFSPMANFADCSLRCMVGQKMVGKVCDPGDHSTSSTCLLSASSSVQWLGKWAAEGKSEEKRKPDYKNKSSFSFRMVLYFKNWTLTSLSFVFCLLSPTLSHRSQEGNRTKQFWGDNVICKYLRVLLGTTSLLLC